jgi:hypothetical protein
MVKKIAQRHHLFLLRRTMPGKSAFSLQ